MIKIEKEIEKEREKDRRWAHKAYIMAVVGVAIKQIMKGISVYKKAPF